MDGILTGCDREQEWMLPFWHQNIRGHNLGIPIAFGDLGMSNEAKNWCQALGVLIPESQIPTLSQPPSREDGWPYGGKRWSMDESPRTLSWFRKPFLMKASPFHRTLWLDLDCQVLTTLSPLFSLRLPETKMAVRGGPRSFTMTSADKKFQLMVKDYNSGVVVFEKDSPLLDFWILFSNRGFYHFTADDRVLSFAIDKYQFAVERIPYKYNWFPSWGANPEAAVLHWIGQNGKMVLKLRALGK